MQQCQEKPREVLVIEQVIALTFLWNVTDAGSHCKDRWGLRSQSEGQDLAPKQMDLKTWVPHSYGNLNNLRNGEFATVGDFQLHFDHHSLRIYCWSLKGGFFFQVLHITWHCWKISTSFPRKDEQSRHSTTPGMFTAHLQLLRCCPDWG